MCLQCLLRCADAGSIPRRHGFLLIAARLHAGRGQILLLHLEIELLLLLIENTGSPLSVKRSGCRVIVLPPGFRLQLARGETRALALIAIRIDDRRVGPLPGSGRAAGDDRQRHEQDEDVAHGDKISPPRHPPARLAPMRELTYCLAADAPPLPDSR